MVSRSWVRALAGACLVALLALVITACGSSGGSSSPGESTSGEGQSTASAEPGGSGEAGGSTSSGVAAAGKDVEEHLAPIEEFTPPGPAIKAGEAKAVSGKAIWYIPVSASIEAFKPEIKGLEEASKALGLRYNICDAKFLPSAESACITQAINSKPAAILTDSEEPSRAANAISAAEAAGIPIVAINAGGKETEKIRFISSGQPESTALVMNWITADSGGEANILNIGAVDNVPAEEATEAGQEELKKNCPNCELDTVNFTAAQIPQFDSITSSALLKNPDAEYGFPEFDFYVPAFQQGVAQAGKTNDIKVVSINAALGQLQDMAKGGKQEVDVGANPNYVGWAAVDLALRMSLGLPAPTNPTVPLRVFDKENVSELDLTEAASLAGEWYGSTSYKQEFPKLWGVG
jgi:ribose transport system substrate-binding protein